MDKDEEKLLITAEIEEANSLLRHPHVQAFLKEYPEHLYKKWLSEDTPEGREELHRMYVNFRAFEIHLRSYLLDGKLKEKRSV